VNELLPPGWQRRRHRATGIVSFFARTTGLTLSVSGAADHWWWLVTCDGHEIGEGRAATCGAAQFAAEHRATEALPAHGPAG
jgi:hypothetical protein